MNSRQRRSANSRDLALAYLGMPDLADIRLKQVIDDHVARVLAATDENLSLAAELLGMHRRSLQRYVRRKRPRIARTKKRR